MSTFKGPKGDEPTILDEGLMKWAPIRQWTEFFDHDRFNIPKPAVISHRILTNLLHYHVNYSMILGVGILFVAISHPLFFFVTSLLICGGLYWFIIRQSQGLLKFRSTILTRNQQFRAFAIASLVICACTGGSELLGILSLFTIVIGAHAMFRIPVVRNRNSTTLADIIAGKRTFNDYLAEELSGLSRNEFGQFGSDNLTSDLESQVEKMPASANVRTRSRTSADSPKRQANNSIADQPKVRV